MKQKKEDGDPIFHGKSDPRHQPQLKKLGRIVFFLLLIAMSLFAAVQFLPISFALPNLFAAPAGSAVEQAFHRRLKLPPGFRLNLYASGLGRVRKMVMSPTGDLIVSVPSHKILRVKADLNGDGRADGHETLIRGLARPHGLYLDRNWLYVAEEARVIRFKYNAGTGKISGQAETVLKDLPSSGGHWTRSIGKGPDGYFYVTAGSSCNVCIEDHPWRAAMIRFRPGDPAEIVATGLRNSVGFDWQPKTADLYALDNGRDWLGDDFPPGELNKIDPGHFYGWPFFNGDNRPDPDFKDGAKQALVPRPPVHKFAAHVAPLSITFLRHAKAADYQNAALVAQHGSWNRSKKIGYRLVSLHWGEAGEISQKLFLTGFEEAGDVLGRPVDIVEAHDGTLFVSDDHAGVIWRISYHSPPQR